MSAADPSPLAAAIPAPNNDPRSRPYHKYNPLSRLFFCWAEPLFFYGVCHTLQHDHLYSRPNEADTKYLLDKFKRHWKVELSRRGRPYLSIALFKCVWWRIFANGLLFGLAVATQFFMAIFIGNITAYFAIDCPSQSDIVDAYWNALWLSLVTIVQVLMFALAGFIGFKNGMLVRIIAISAIYDKILSLSQGTVSRLTIGHIVNLASNDVHRFDQALAFIWFGLLGPVFVIVSGVVLYYVIGVTSFIAVALMIGQVPIQGLLSKLLSYLRLEAAKVTDERVKVMNEVITGIRVIKMYGWENAFHQLVSAIRHNEMMIILKSSIIRAINLSSFPTSLPTIMFAVFSVSAAIGDCITLRKVFITLTLLSFARNYLSISFVTAVANLSEAFVAIKRIQKFLLLKDLTQSDYAVSDSCPPITSTASTSDGLSNDQDSFPVVSINNLCCSWSAEDSDNLTLKDITFTVNKEHPLIAVVGSVGCGKSTLLQCLLGELPPISGYINMKGTVAYAGQEPWLFSDTLRENIVFGQPYIPDWYNTVIDLCTLDKDISILPDGDMTIVGERGVTLSGGQKARVGLARAVYRRAGIYLLDDPLSAVDVAVSRHIFNKCIKGFLTQSSVVILVTHQLQYVQQCDTVLVLTKGCMSVCGDPSKALQGGSTDITKILTSQSEEPPTNIFSVREFEKSKENVNINDQPLISIAEENISNGLVKGQIIPTMPHPLSTANGPRPLHITSDDSNSEVLEEDKPHPQDSNGRTTVLPDKHLDRPKELSQEGRGEGSITYRTYQRYFNAGGGCIYTLLLIAVFLLGEVSIVVSEGWLADWANDESDTCMESANTTDYCNSSGISNYTASPPSIDVNTRIGVYGGLVLLVWVLCIARTIFFYIILLRAATSTHNKMFISVLRSPILFFDTNPVGRILNRFSKDVGFLDDILIYIFCEFLQFFTRFLAIVVTSSIAVYHLSVVIVLMVTVFAIFRWYYLKSFREIKRLEALARSPLYSHISMTLQGLPTIRAYSKQHEILDTFYKYQNSHTQAWYLYLVSARWFGIRIDTICAFFVSLLAFVSIPLADVLNASFIGLALTYSVSLIGLFQYCVRHSAEVESLMVSAERVMGYGQLLSENDGELLNSSPPSNWPDKGRIEITDLCYRHSSDGPLVLNNINLIIQSGEKVGIVGRTGAGKSSLIGAFFRLAQPNGSIKIDGVECLDIPLEYLRPRISIIPQDPVLFSGSVRYNLDPFNQYDDDNIWTSLKQVQLSSVVESLDGGLEAEVTEGGSNFSVGERQLFCLARALLRRNKILMLDEATANVDLKTDSIIQQVIRQYFNECTVLTIAHRLDTVMDSDKIMVLRNGELIEYDEPYQLLCNPESYLLKLVEQTGPEAAEALKRMAFNGHMRK